MQIWRNAKLEDTNLEYSEIMIRKIRTKIFRQPHEPNEYWRGINSMMNNMNMMNSMMNNMNIMNQMTQMQMSQINPLMNNMNKYHYLNLFISFI